ncbi:MAG: ribonuclease R [Proteobacteria bacterium]|nr:ribonuclease R [Pseudomonadota bacterium]
MKKKTSRGASAKQGGSLPPWMPEAMVKHGRTPSATQAGRRHDPPHGKMTRPATPSSTRSAGRDPHAAREDARYERPIASREAILQWLADSEGPQKVEAIAAGLRITEPELLEALDKRLAAMQRDGQVLVNRRGGYAPASRLDLIAGSVIANPEGFGFLRPDAGGDDLFLPPHEMRKVMHGDRVLASVTGIDGRGRRTGAVVELLERRARRVTGRYVQRGGLGFVKPDDKRVLQDIIIPPGADGGARDGQLVVCELDDGDGDAATAARRAQPFGRVLVVLGDKLTPSLVVEAAIHGHGIPHEFSQAVLAEAAAIPVAVDAKAAAGRVDLRALPLVTIDGEDAKDFDDAVYCEPNREGFRLVVAIADVSAYAKPGTALDEEAQLRGTSVYFPGFVVPMLPESLSNGICSLKPEVERLCFVCDMQIDRTGQTAHARFYTAVMRSHARLTYTQVWNAIGDGIPDDTQAQARSVVGGLLPQLQRLHQLYRLLDRARARRGAIEFESSETRFVLGPAGEVVQAGMLVRNDAHKLIEECMIAANVQAARFLHEYRIPAPYRVHERPPENKYADLLEFLSEFGLRLPPWGKVQPKDFTALIRTIRERPDAALLESVLLRSQSLAVYSTHDAGHFGLALEAYAHFTSPIRRYPDLLVHRAIKHALAGGSADTFTYTPHAMEQLALTNSEQSRRADEASREVDERYRAAWMEQHVGSQFDGVISGVASFGLFVELDDSKVNGLIHVTQLPHDYYHFDPLRKTLTGSRRQVEYRLGDRARVLVLRASVEDRRIDFRLVERLSDAPAAAPPTLASLPLVAARTKAAKPPAPTAKAKAAMAPAPTAKAKPTRARKIANEVEPPAKGQPRRRPGESVTEFKARTRKETQR